MRTADPGRRLASRAAVFLAVAALGLGAAVAAPTAALAICNPMTCGMDPPPPPPPAPPPAPVTTTISGIAPPFAFFDDNVTITGTGFLGATVTIGGLPATIVSETGTTIVATVPTVPGVVAGSTLAVVVASRTGTASSTLVLSSELEASAGTTFGLNSQFGQGEDGSAAAFASLDRAAGSVTTNVTVTDRQWWSSLSVAVSVAFVDKAGVVIGFSKPQTVTACGVAFAWHCSTTVQSPTIVETHATNPALEPQNAVKVRSLRVLLVRDGEAELLSTLGNAVEAAQTLASVLSTLGIA